MKAADIIKQISFERGIDAIGKGPMDLVPLNDLNVHKREVWNMSITDKPEEYFIAMDKKNRNKAGYYYKFPVNNAEEGAALCHELSKDFGAPPCEMSALNMGRKVPNLYLAIHIHPEFKFTPKTNKSVSATQEVVLNYV